MNFSKVVCSFIDRIPRLIDLTVKSWNLSLSCRRAHNQIITSLNYSIYSLTINILKHLILRKILSIIRYQPEFISIKLNCSQLDTQKHSVLILLLFHGSNNWNFLKQSAYKTYFWQLCSVRSMVLIDVFYLNTKWPVLLSDPICPSSLLSGRLSETLSDSETDTHGSD